MTACCYGFADVTGTKKNDTAVTHRGAVVVRTKRLTSINQEITRVAPFFRGGWRIISRGQGRSVI